MYFVVITPKYTFFKVRQIRLTKIRCIWKYKYALPKYALPKVKYTHIWLKGWLSQSLKVLSVSTENRLRVVLLKYSPTPKNGQWNNPDLFHGMLLKLNFELKIDNRTMYDKCLIQALAKPLQCK